MSDCFNCKHRFVATTEEPCAGCVGNDKFEPNELSRMEQEITALRQEAEFERRMLSSALCMKDNAYHERNQLVALLSAIFPASLERHPEEEEWEDDWRWVVFIDLPTGQCSWHIQDDELPLFDHLLRHQGRKWDGHTTKEKYDRIREYIDTAGEK